MSDPFSIFIDGAQHSRFGVDADLTKAVGGFYSDRMAITPFYLPYRYYDEWNTTLGVAVVSVTGDVSTKSNGTFTTPFDQYASGTISSSGDVLLSLIVTQNIRIHGFLGGGSVDATYRLFVNGQPKSFCRTSASERNAKIAYTNESSLSLTVGDTISVFVKPSGVGGTFEAYLYGIVG